MEGFFTDYFANSYELGPLGLIPHSIAAGCFTIAAIVLYREQARASRIFQTLGWLSVLVFLTWNAVDCVLRLNVPFGATATEDSAARQYYATRLFEGTLALASLVLIPHLAIIYKRLRHGSGTCLFASGALILGIVGVVAVEVLRYALRRVDTCPF